MISNRAYLENKPYNDIVSHLEKEMRLNAQGAQDETTLVPLNTVDVESKDQKKEPNQRGYCFHCGRYGHHNARCHKLKKDSYYETKLKNGERNHVDPSEPKRDTCGKMHKNENCLDGANAANDYRKNKGEFAIPTYKISEHPLASVATNPKNKSPRLRRGDVHNRRSPKSL